MDDLEKLEEIKAKIAELELERRWLEDQIAMDDGKCWSELEFDVFAELQAAGAPVQVRSLKCLEGLSITHWEQLSVAFPNLDRWIQFLPFNFRIALKV